MTSRGGWAGTILDLDLTSGKATRVPLDPELARTSIGALGFGTKFLYESVPPEVAPLSPESVITIGLGPLVGTMTPASSRICVVGRSPITGIFARSNSGGLWGSEVKWAGYDAVVLRGQAPHPVYVFISNDRVEIRDASHLWGLDTWKTEHQLRRELGDYGLKTLCIGPAGENQSFGAAIVNDLARAAATRGLGAVLGAKRLKAIAVKGSKGLELADSQRMVDLSKKLCERFKLDPMYESHSKYGTNTWVGDVVFKVVARATGQEPPAGLMSGAFWKLYEHNLSCSSCPLHCSHFYRVRSGDYAGTVGEGVEGNTQLVGESVHVFDADFICAFNNACNQLGLDTMHAGATIGWAMHLYKEGIISNRDTDDIELMPGNAKAVFQMMDKMSRNEGFGRLLNLGPLLAAKEIGSEAEKLVSHVKGYPSTGAGFMSSVKTTLAHNIATRGFDHLTGSPGIESPNRQPEMSDEVLTRLGRERYGDDKFFTDIGWDYRPKYARRVYETENLFALSDMVGTCKFAAQEVLFDKGVSLSDYVELLNASTGEKFDAAELARAACREMLLERAYNARVGIRKVDDYPHALQWELRTGECHPLYDRKRYRIGLEDYTKNLEEYYRLRGCDEVTGVPTADALRAHGLGHVADDLARRGVIA